MNGNKITAHIAVMAVVLLGVGATQVNAMKVDWHTGDNTAGVHGGGGRGIRRPAADSAAQGVAGRVLGRGGECQRLVRNDRSGGLAQYDAGHDGC